MKKKRNYFIIILVAVLCGCGLVYWGKDGSLVASTQTVHEEVDRIFPAPAKTLYAMQLYLDVPERTIYGESEISTENTSEGALKELWFTVYPNAFRQQQGSPAPSSAYYAGFDPGWMEIEALQVNGQIASVEGDGPSLRVVLPQEIAQGEAVNVQMQWKAKIPQVKYRFGCQDTAFLLGNFYPTLNVLGKDGWHNSYSSSFGDPFCFHMADYIVNITIPEGFTLASTGEVIARANQDDGREIYSIGAEGVRDFCLLVMYDYKEIRQKIHGVEIAAYCPAGEEANTRGLMARAGDILHFYSCTFGTYPYEDFKLALVPMLGFHGMEYSGMVFLSEDFFSGRYSSQQDFVLAHEIAHQWWYGMVGNDQLQEPWLDEGLANWSARLYGEKVLGQPRPQGSVQVKNLNRELCDMQSRQDYYSTAYTAGEAFWYGLEQELGQDTVIKVLRHYLSDNRNQIASMEDVLKAIEAETNKDMSAYIQRWFTE